MKKLVGVVSAIIIATAAIYFVHETNKRDTERPNIETYSKKQMGILRYSSTPKEITQARMAETPKDKVLKRELFPKNSSIDLSKLEYMNKVTDKWRSKLSNNLLRFQKPDTKVVIKTQKSMVILNKKKGQYVEEVAISFINENGLINGFSALVDSETGKILKTWNRTTWLIKKQHGMKYQGEL